MAIRHLVWSCVACGQEGALQPNGKSETCSRCATTYRRGRGANIEVQSPNSPARTYHAREIAAVLPDPGRTGVARCGVRDWVGDKRMYALGRYIGLIDKYGDERVGTVTLTDENITFEPEDGSAGFRYSLLDLRAIQPGSHALQIRTTRGLHSLHFLDASAYPWERRLRNAVANAYQRDGRTAVAEFLPMISPRRSATGSATTSRLRRLVHEGDALRPKSPWQYRLCCWIARSWDRFGGGLTVEGTDNIPRTGAFFVLVNHQSYLEPMLVPAVMPRAIYAMAKTTQFTVPFFGWLMAQVMAFPVRRFEVDAHAVRYLARRMSEGSGVMVFPEGERCWDGEISDTRLGVARMVMAFDVPVIPCRVEGAYDAWPRWASGPQRQRIRITFRPALQLPATNSRAEREQQLLNVTNMIAQSIRAE